MLTLRRHRRAAVIGAIAASACVLVLIPAILNLTSPSHTLTLQTTETFPTIATVHGDVPYLTVTPENSTFTLDYSVTAYQYPLNLSYDPSSTYLMHYVNGTAWQSYSQPCPTSETQQPASSSSPDESITGASVITITGLPCGQPPGSGWGAPNSALIDGHIDVTASDFNVTVAPTTVAAGQTESISVTVSIALHPGDYGVNLIIDVAASNSQRTFFDVGAMPIMVVQ